MTIFYSLGPRWLLEERRVVEAGEVDVGDDAYDLMQQASDSIRTLCFWLGAEGEEG